MPPNAIPEDPKKSRGGNQIAPEPIAEAAVVCSLYIGTRGSAAGNGHIAFSTERQGKDISPKQSVEPCGSEGRNSTLTKFGRGQIDLYIIEWQDDFPLLRRSPGRNTR